MPCSEKRARLLLERGRAVVVRRPPRGVDRSRILQRGFCLRLYARKNGGPVGEKHVDRLGTLLGVARNAGENKVGRSLAAHRIALPVEASSGGRTKYNRYRLGIPKTHAHDAACVGKVDTLTGWRIPLFDIKATGRGSYCRTRLDAYRFPRGYCVRQKGVRGFQTGDIVRADVVQGKKTGTYIGRVAVRASGSFNVQTPTGVVQGINARHCTLVHRSDGYSYRAPRLFPSDESGGIRRGKIR
jgi:hypothetical protein